MNSDHEQRRLHRPLDGIGYLLNWLTVVLWGGNSVATSFSTDSLPPLAVSGLRFALATVVMLAWCLIERVSFRLKWEQLPAVLVMGVLLYLQIWTFTLGVSLSSSSHASLFVNTYVFWVVAFDHFISHHHRLNAGRLAGVALAAAGVLILLAVTGQSSVQQRDQPTVLGDAILLLSALLFAVKFVFQKHSLKVIGATELIFWHDVVAVGLFALTSASFETLDWSRVSLAAWIGLGYQGLLVGGVCFALQAHLLRWYSATQIAIFSFATPILGVLLGSLMRGDEITLGLLFAGGCVAAGIYLVNRR